MKISHAGPPKGSTTTGITPDFTIFTSAMEADSERENVVRMIGSSTERDLHGDTMAISALTDMAQVEPGMVIWLNHEYFLPESLFGSLLEKPELRLKDGIADLHIVSSVETTNPNAVQTYGYIRKGTRLGCSIGCMILECEIDEENDDGRSWWPPLIITHVLPLEWSVVGIPANQRSWVENAIKGLFERSLSSGKTDDALRLAPAMKSLWPKDFPVSLRGIEDVSLRKELEAVPARKSRERIEWDPHQQVFMMNQKGIAVPLERKDISAFMARSKETPRYATPPKGWEPSQVAPKNEMMLLGWDPAKDNSAVLVKSDGNGNVLEARPFAETEERTKKETDVNTIKEGDTVTLASTGEHVTVKAVDEQGRVTVAAKDAPNATEKVEEPTTTNLDIVAISKESDEEPEETVTTDGTGTFIRSADPLDVQLFNLLAARLGQPVITLDSQGQVQGSHCLPELSPEAIQEAIAKALEFGETVKSGNTFSKKNQQTLQSLHNSIVDMCKSQFHPCDEMSEDSEDGDGKDGDKEKGVLSAELVANSEIPALREDIHALIKTLNAQGHLVDAKAVKDLMGRIEAADKRLKDIQATTKQAEERLASLQNAPLGQPTLLKRGIQNNGDTATYQDFKELAQRSSVATMNGNERRWSLEEALKSTTIVPKTVAGEERLYRMWPDGVGGSVKDGVRPALTGRQRSYMYPGDQVAYNEGEEAAVICYDDPGGVEM
jgi:hypothetical protein